MGAYVGKKSTTYKLMGVECICIGHEKRKEQQQHLKQSIACL